MEGDTIMIPADGSLRLYRSLRQIAAIAVPLLLALSAGGTALAAAICGTVTDAISTEPVAGAGVFLRTAGGAYTGDHTSTAADGHYCLSGLVAGTYTLEVRVDDYVVSYRTGIEVADDITDVPVLATVPAVRLAPPWPNPSAGQIKVRVIVQRPAPVRLSVYDARGRLLRAWSAEALSPGDHDYLWDGLGPDGHPVPSGLYLIQVRSQGQAATRSLVLAR